MREYVCARCGDHSLLFPAENISFIESVPSRATFCEWRRRSRLRSCEPVLDVRRLLEVRDPAPAQEGVTLRWCSTDGARALTLLVDAVEEIVNCHAEDLIEARILPRRLRPMCDHVTQGPRGRLRLCVRLDVRLPLELPGDRRSYARSLLATSRDPVQASSEELAR